MSFYNAREEKRPKKKELLKRRNFAPSFCLGSPFCGLEARRFIAIVRGSSLDALFEKRGINASREREIKREREKERKRDPTPIASTRAFERVDLVVGAAVSRREREREREIGFLLPSSFLN